MKTTIQYTAVALACVGFVLFTIWYSYETGYQDGRKHSMALRDAQWTSAFQNKVDELYVAAGKISASTNSVKMFK